MRPHYQDEHVTLHHGDALAVLADLPDRSADCIVTSPPYVGIDLNRDYLDLSLRTRLAQPSLITEASA